jgi:predicted acyltransferase
MPDTGLNLTYAPRRLKSLDILRALAILLMIFSGLLPKTLPNWMDHGYNAHYLPNEAGIWSLRPEVTAGETLFIRDWQGQPWASFTWVDLVFPMFLFAMGAAIPTALSRLMETASLSKAAIVGVILKRWLILILFAALVVHLSPVFMKSSVPNAGRLIVIASFLLAMLFFVRWPPGTPPAAERTIRLTALAGITSLIVAYAVRNQNAFAWSQSDKIILVLAQTYLVSSLVWLVSRHHPVARFVLFIPVILLAHYFQLGSDELAARRWLGTQPIALISPVANVISQGLNLSQWLVPDVASETWKKYFSPLFDLSSLWDFSWYKYLFVVIPGTIVGDWMRAWNNRRTVSANPFDRDMSMPVVHRFALLSVVLLCLALLVGLRHTGYPFMSIGGPLRTPWLALVLGLPALAFVAWTILPTAYGSLWICRRLFYFGSGFLLVGLLLACLPNGASGVGYFEGGISKGPPATLSYYFVSVGLCTLLLMALAAKTDYNRVYSRTSSLLEANGQNPMLAYFLAKSVLGAVMSLSVLGLFNFPWGSKIESLDDLVLSHYFNHHQWLAVGWAAVKTLLVAVVVWIFSINRIFWRA